MHDDSVIFDLVAGTCPPPMGVLQRLSIAAMLASGVVLGLVEARGSAIHGVVPLVAACTVLVVSSVATFLLGLPARSGRSVAAEDADLKEGSRLMRAVALDRFGVTFTSDDNATWLMRYGAQVAVDGHLHEVKVARVGNEITLIDDDGHVLEPLSVA